MKRLLFTLPILVVGTTLPAPARAAEPTQAARREHAPLPKWQKVEAAAKAALTSRPGYKPGDLIARSEAQSLMTRLAALGWTPDNAGELLAAVPGDDEFIIKRLRGKDKEGERFMRQIAKYPLGYDRLDHMLRLPRGPVFTADLIHNPGGHQMIQYMATAQGGIELGKMLSGDPGGEDFNAPTGRIYTADQLVARLKLSYERALAKK